MNRLNGSRWTAFWLAPSALTRLDFVRQALGIVTAIYFIASWSDVSTWYQQGAPASSSNLATFFRTAELTSDARWMVSPLFVWDSIFAGSRWSESALIYRLYLVIGVVLAVLTVFPKQLQQLGLPARLSGLLGGFLPSLLLWVWFVGWANRIVLLAGIVEPLLSVSLAALAIAPCCLNRVDAGQRSSWTATLSRRLLAVQATLIGGLTSATMIASPTWWNGMGAYALVAPTQDRLFDVRGTFFETPWVYELTTFLLVCALPLGLILAWQTNFRRLGIGLILAWCVLIGLLSANVLYAATLGIIATTLGDDKTLDHASAGANGAKTLDGRNVATNS
ncbi:hypothetical protein NHH03_06960 [Stieleria sp. TO1_6]|uniref:hypothetical protein n=1 Tax=Stieleria tagensis TaxID=2956795 RepID=UPI00209BB95B|nr:hypothetical protein [Stieleria tagensis]MCO8121470.1 hypothetical protein [Stieleria tagensis]